MIDFRILWYAVLLWVLAIFVGGFVILPWFYLVLTILVFWLTVTFFKKGLSSAKIRRRRQDKILIRGLRTSLFWSVAVLALDFLVFVGFNFQNLIVYFSDPRSWFKYPLIILVPVIYSLVLENMERRVWNRRNFDKPADNLSRAGTLA
ncbi:MAG: hypothetical protein Q7S45_01130 [Candidatus Curtissbacteria bacterium]|nr:hypothetical protein [Candidatus Curtissbacteria bacterium]